MQYYRSHSYGGVVREPHVGNKAEDACNRIMELKRCWTAMEEQVCSSKAQYRSQYKNAKQAWNNFTLLMQKGLESEDSLMLIPEAETRVLKLKNPHFCVVSLS